MKLQSITLPQLADGVCAATIVRWFQQPGDVFAAGDPLVELEVEDALVHLEASQSGTLAQVLAQPRQTVGIGAELAQVEATGGPAPQSKPETTFRFPRNARKRQAHSDAAGRQHDGRRHRAVVEGRRR